MKDEELEDAMRKRNCVYTMWEVESMSFCNVKFVKLTDVSKVHWVLLVGWWVHSDGSGGLRALVAFVCVDDLMGFMLLFFVCAGFVKMSTLKEILPPTKLVAGFERCEMDHKEDDDKQKEIKDTTEQTKVSFEKIVNVRLSAAKPKNIQIQSQESQFINYAFPSSTCDFEGPAGLENPFVHLQMEESQREKEQKEQELRALAQKARSERVGPGGIVVDGTGSYTPFEKNMMDIDEPMRIEHEHEHEHEHKHVNDLDQPKESEAKREDQIEGEKIHEERRKEREIERSREEADIDKVNQKVGEVTDSLSDGKASWFRSVSTSKANLVPKQLSLDNCSIKIVFLFHEGDAPTSYSTSRVVGEKDVAKQKSDDIGPAITDQENKLWRSPSAGCGSSVSSSIKGAKNGNRGRLSTSGTGDVEVSFSVVVATMALTLIIDDVVELRRRDCMMVMKEIVNRLLEEVERSWNDGLSKTLMMKERRMKKVKLVVKYENCMI
nr:SNW/SKI-interacting protein [Tanacetum cinerariifolium]